MANPTFCMTWPKSDDGLTTAATESVLFDSESSFRDFDLDSSTATAALSSERLRFVPFAAVLLACEDSFENKDRLTDDRLTDGLLSTFSVSISLRPSPGKFSDSASDSLRQCTSRNPRRSNDVPSWSLLPPARESVTCARQPKFEFKINLKLSSSRGADELEHDVRPENAQAARRMLEQVSREAICVLELCDGPPHNEHRGKQEQTSLISNSKLEFPFDLLPTPPSPVLVACSPRLHHAAP